LGVLLPVLFINNRSVLERRAGTVNETLAYIQQLQSEIDANTSWLNLCTQKRRYLFLSELRSWYENELAQTLEELDEERVEADDASRKGNLSRPSKVVQ
jgi:hypothetical protein